MKKVLIVFVIFIIFFFNIYKEFSINDKTFSYLLFIMYLLIYMLYFKKARLDFISSENLILFIFPLVTFLYYPLLEDEDISKVFVAQTITNINTSTIIYSQVVSLISIILFLLGNSLSSKSLFKKQSINKINNKRKVIHIVTTVIIIISIFKGLLNIVNRYGTDLNVGLTDAEALISILTILFTISSVFEFNKLNQLKIDNFNFFLKNINLLYALNVIFICGLFFIAGFRSGIFPIILPIIYLYNKYIHKIKFVSLLIGVIFGIFIMSMLKFSRLGINDGFKEFTLLSIFGDFVAANTGLFYLVNYTNVNGAQWGANAIYQIISFIPFAQFFVINIFSPEISLNSSNFYMQSTNWEYGLGTNFVGDLYYTFDIYGPLFFLFLFGFFIKCLRYDSNNNLLAQIFLMLILGNSIMFCRIEFFSIIRYLGLALFIYLFMKIFIKK